MLVFNLSNEPAFKFNLCVFGDKSPEVETRASYFTKNQVIYLETSTERYELYRNQSLQQVNDDDSDPGISTYTFSKVTNPWSIDNDFFADPKTEIPLAPKHKETLATDLDWHDLVWSDFSLEVVKDDNKIKRLEPLHNFKLYDIRIQSDDSKNEENKNQNVEQGGEVKVAN